MRDPERTHVWEIIRRLAEQKLEILELSNEKPAVSYVTGDAQPVHISYTILPILSYMTRVVK